MYVDYKDIELLKKLVNRHGKIVGRRKTGCKAASQHAVTQAGVKTPLIRRVAGLFSFTMLVYLSLIFLTTLHVQK